MANLKYMKILIIGSGGREHIIAEKYAECKRVTVVFVAPGNDFMEETNKKIRIVPHIHQLDLEKIVAFAKKEKVDLVDVAMDDPLAQGAIDLLLKNGIAAFGPTKKAAEIEWSKTWSRDFMKKYKLPTPHYQSFTNEKKAIAYISKLPEQPLFIKASGLALGKGALFAGNRKEAIAAIKEMKNFGNAGKEFLIEECLFGEEFSLFAICDGKSYTILGNAQDHKRALDNDKGLNTGGMGCVSPTGSLTPSIIRIIEQKILKPFMKGMKEEGRPYTGILYLGGMITKKGVQIVEFNARWGDPEAEVILPGIKNDYIDIVQAVLNHSLHKLTIKVDNKVRISIAGYAHGYPDDYSAVKGKEIFGLDLALHPRGVNVFGAGIKKVGKNFVVNGGRVFHLVAEGDTIQQARKRAYNAMRHITIEGNNLHYRTDIGWRELEREL